jgi:hypothetical protein
VRKFSSMVTVVLMTSEKGSNNICVTRIIFRNKEENICCYPYSFATFPNSVIQMVQIRTISLEGCSVPDQDSFNLDPAF